ncbi:MAG: hypothetical protein E6G62_06430 [Actinobacteria bacterium]|nr:MAG: hypothetical protein E6G62_06430 [Actinomycetota bacterium]
MSAIPYDSQDQGPEAPELGSFATPGRRRRLFNRKSAALAAAITCAAGFYAGVRVEKSQLGGTATAASTTAASSARAGATAPGFGGTGGGPRAGFAAAGRGGNASVGTVASVNGNTIYLTDSSGNTVKVTLSGSTKLTKSQSVSKASVRPGDTVVIQGLKSTNGTITATSVSDSGTGAGRAGTGATGGGPTSTSAGTAG